MSNNILLQKLENSRTAILLAEIGVWLHLLGKLSEEFIDDQTGKQIPKPVGLQKRYVRGVFEPCNPLQLDMNFFNLSTDKQFWTNTVVKALKKQINTLTNQDDSISLEEVTSFHKNFTKYKGSNFFIKLLVASHGRSGAEEKNLNEPNGWPDGDIKKERKQPDKNNTFHCTAFGFEEQPILTRVNLKIIRDNLVSNICPVLEFIKNNPSKLDESYWQRNYPKLVDEFSKAYKVTVGDTQRPVNDVTLWDATSLASALFKSALAKMILEGWTDPIDIKTNKTLINWRILRINLDSLSIMAKGIKIGDILGYRKAIEDSFSECKEIIEVKYCLGNEIYRDGTGIYFSFPDVDATILGFWNDLVTELRVAVQNIESDLSPDISFSENSFSDFKDLTSQRVLAEKDIAFPYKKDVLSQDISNSWVKPPRNSEICPICRLRPMEENSDGCEYCLNERRLRTSKNWSKNPQQTIWLDEVSDHNDRLALLIGSFGLSDWLNRKLISTMAKKTASSGRVRRVWETTQDFIECNIFKDILPEFPYAAGTSVSDLRKKRIQFKIDPNPNITEGATLDIDLKGIRFSPVCIDKNSGIFVSTVNIQILKNLGRTPDEILSYIQNNKNIKITKSKKDASILECKNADENFQNYLPYVEIYDFPDQFMAIVPAYDALNIATKITQEYEVQFSKVRDRLPFHIGIIAFHRKTPLYIAMDAGKRLIEAFKKNCNTINANVDGTPRDITDIRFGPKVKELKLQVDPCYSSTPLKWHVSYSTGYSNQEDEWHPYFRFNGGNQNIKDYSFEYDGNGHYAVHVKKLQSADSVSIEPSYFKLSFLESAADRFKIDESFRPLDDMHRLNELWNKIETKLRSNEWSISQLYAFWQETKKRYEYYGGDIVWENFVKSSIKNMLKISPQSDDGKELFQVTKDGLLDLCLCWNLQVRKIKPKVEEVVS